MSEPHASAKPKVLVTGASGLIGGLTIRDLSHKYEFSGLSRRPVAGIQVPFATEMQVGPLSFVGTVTLAEFDVPIAAAQFAVPDLGAGSDDKAGAKGKSKAARPAKRGKEKPADATAP